MTHYFAAIPVPSELVAERIRNVSQQYGLSSHYKVIPHPEDLHITLLFFGALTPAQLALVKQEMQSVADQTDPFHIAIDGVSFFGNPSGPRVVYLSVQQIPQLTKLYRNLGERLQSVLQKPAPRDYTPHITIAKKKKDQSSVPIEQESFTPLSWAVPGMILYSIDPSASPKYSPECVFSFSGRSFRIDT